MFYLSFIQKLDGDTNGTRHTDILWVANKKQPVIVEQKQDILLTVSAALRT